MMEHRSEIQTGQELQSHGAPRARLGTLLREAREKMGLSVTDVAGQIKFAPRQIEALEAEDFKHLPEIAFVRGFVRSYARILQLDAQELLELLPHLKSVGEVELSPPSVGGAFPAGHASQQQNLIWLGAALLLSVVVVAFAVWHYTSPSKHEPAAKVTRSENTAQTETPVTLPPEEPATAVQESKPVQTAPAAEEPRTKPSAPAESQTRQTKSSLPPVAAASKPAAGTAEPVDTLMSDTTAASAAPEPTSPILEVRLTFDAESWTEVTQVDGKVLSSRVHDPGSEMRLHGHVPLTLVIGRASSVHLFKEGEPVDLAPYTNTASDVARLTLE